MEPSRYLRALLLWAFVFILASMTLNFFWRLSSPIGVSIGVAYALINAAVMIFFWDNVSAAAASPAGGAILFLWALLKYPVLLLVLYVLWMQGEPMLWSGIAGTLIFIPASIFLIR